MKKSFDEFSADKKTSDIKNAFLIALVFCLILSSFFFVSCISESKPSELNIQNCVNPNVCSFDELMLLDGIGQEKAKAIIECRNYLIKTDPRQKPFKDPNSLRMVRGIGPETIRKIQQNLCF